MKPCSTIKIWSAIVPAIFILVSFSSGKAACAAETKGILEYVPAEYGIMACVDPIRIMDEAGAKSTVDKTQNAAGKKILKKLKNVRIFFSRSAEKDGLIDFMCVSETGLDPDQVKKTVENYGWIKIGEYSGKPAFRYYNLAAVCTDERVIFGSTAAVKKAVETKEKKGPSLAGDARFVRLYDECGAAARKSGAAAYGIVTKSFIGGAASDTGVSYAESLAAADAAIFTVAGRKVKIELLLPPGGSSATLASSFMKEAETSAVETKEALEYVDTIELDEGGRGARKRAVAREAFTRKALRFALEFNSKVKAAAGSGEVAITAGFDENVMRIFYELIKTHPNSWWSVGEYFISSEISCERNRNILENASLVYLSEHPGAGRGVDPEALCDEGYIGFEPACHGGGEYSVKIGEKGKIVAECSLHSKK